MERHAGPTQAELEELLRQGLSEHPAVGVTVAVARDGNMITATSGRLSVEGPDPVELTTLYAMGSVAKVFTGFMICQLVDEGRLALDDKVITILPALRIQGEAQDQITVRHLLTHTSGLPDDWFVCEDLDTLLARLSETSLTLPPGRICSYANTGYALLGAIIETLDGRHWEDALTDRLLQPLGIGDAAFRVGDEVPAGAAPEHVPDGDGGHVVGELYPRTGRGFAAAGSTLYATAPALARLAQTCVTGRTSLDPDATSLLSPQLSGEMTRTQVDVPGYGAMASGWGLGWYIDGGDRRRPAKRPIVAHSGSSTVHVQAAVDDGTVVVVATNSITGDALAHKIAHAVLGAPNYPVPSDDAAVPEPAFLGEYGNSTFGARVSESEGRLVLETPIGMPAVDLLPVEGSSFLAKIAYGTMDVTFLDQQDGKAQILHVGGRVLVRT